MTTPEFFDATPELTTIYRWARARYAAPWAVFFAVLIRVAASVGPHVRLPGIIGGHASLNLLVAFVSPSGGGKGISDKVGRLAWPAEILELPLGSGEGIDETFTLRGKESADNERVAAAIFNCPEIDILTGLEARQGSTILGRLKSFAMGEQLGSTNASKANSRNVPAHSYRGCLSVGAQPGHTGVIFKDTTGGTPQRFLWALTIDADMPADAPQDPQPLDTRMPLWETDPAGVVEIQYEPAEIRQTIIETHLARQRGEGDALDGHWMLTRCKVAAAIALMHRRTVVSEQDWALSETVMAVSDSTRDWILQQAKQAERAKVRDRAIARADGDKVYDDRRMEQIRRSALGMLQRDGEQAVSDLRRRFGTTEKRLMFDATLLAMKAEGLVYEVDGQQKGSRVGLVSEVGHGDQAGHPTKPQVIDRDQPGHGDQSATVTALDSRRSADSDRPAPTRTALAFILSYITDHAGVEGWVPVSQIYAAGIAEGHTREALKGARLKSTDPVIESTNTGPNSMWRIATNTEEETTA